MSTTPHVIDATFVTSAPSIREAVPETMSEVVFLGRSNVGKSSTINGLCERKNLAKSSATPGKTQLINFFDIRYRYGDEDYPLRFVDLPGFGFAKVAKTLKQAWQKNLTEFITKRQAIRLFIHLRDARHPSAKIDDEVETYIRSFLRPDQRYIAVFTKGDKLNQKECAKLKKDFPDAIVLSNLKRSGYEALHREILFTIFGIGKDRG